MTKPTKELPTRKRRVKKIAKPMAELTLMEKIEQFLDADALANFNAYMDSWAAAQTELDEIQDKLKENLEDFKAIADTNERLLKELAVRNQERAAMLAAIESQNVKILTLERSISLVAGHQRTDDLTLHVERSVDNARAGRRPDDQVGNRDTAQR